MERSFDPIEEIRDVVEVEPGAEPPEVACPNAERLAASPSGATVKRETQELVHRFLERLPAPADLRLQLGRDIFVQRQGRSHIMMLRSEHQDVKRVPRPYPGQSPDAATRSRAPVPWPYEPAPSVGPCVPRRR